MSVRFCMSKQRIVFLRLLGLLIVLSGLYGLVFNILKNQSASPWALYTSIIGMIFIGLFFLLHDWSNEV